MRAQVRGLLFVLAAFFDGQDDVALPESRRRQLEHLAHAGAGLGQRADQELVAVSAAPALPCARRVSAARRRAYARQTRPSASPSC